MCTLLIRLSYIFSAMFLTLAMPLRADVIAEPSPFDGWELWGDVLIGETRTGIITLRNEGGPSEVITDVVLNFSAPPGFSIQTVPLPKTLEDGEETAIDVTYRPTFDSMTMGQVEVSLDNQGPLFIDLFGFAMAAETETSCDDGLDNDMNGLTDCEDPVCESLPICVPDPLSVSPSEFSFPDVIAGTDDSHTATFIVHNDSEVTVTVTGYSFSPPTGFSYEFEPGFTGELEAGHAYFVYATFSPPTPGEYTTDFNIAFSIGENTGELVIPLDGTGLPAGDIEVTPTDHDFGYQYPASSWLEVSVRNVTPNPIELEDIRLTSDAFLISDTSTCVEGNTLQAYSECHILLRYSPIHMNAEVGDVFAGQLIITAFDPDGRTTVVDLTGSVPESSWFTSHLSTATEDAAFFADGLDLALGEDYALSTWEHTAHVCFYQDGYLRYVKADTTSSSAWIEPQYPLEYIDPAAGEIMDCAIGIMEGSDYPEIAYVVDDGEYVTVYHRDLFRSASGFVQQVRYEGESDDRTLKHTEIELEKDDFDRTHIAFSVEVYPKSNANPIEINGQITRPSPAISWEQSEMAWWGTAPAVINYIGKRYLGPHPFIGTPDALSSGEPDGLFLAFTSSNVNIKRARNFHLGIRGYRWDWQDVDSSALTGFAVSTTTTLSLDITNPGYVSVAAVSGAEHGVTLKNGQYQYLTDIVEEYSELSLSPLHEGVCEAEETSDSVSFKEFSHDTDGLKNEQVIFNDPLSSTVRFTLVDASTGEVVLDDDLGLFFQQSSQYSETVGPSGSDLQITATSNNSKYVAYLDTSGQLLFAKRFKELPPSSVDPAYPITLSPMRETFTGVNPDTSAFKVFMLRNHAQETIYIDPGKLRITTMPGDEGKWEMPHCGFFVPTDGYYVLNQSTTATLPFCVKLMEVPVHPVAYLEVTTEGGTTIRAELIANEVLDSDGDGLPDYLEITTGTDPYDADTDDDGLEGGPLDSEDLNANGFVDPGETDPRIPDTDGDGLYDGLEKGLVEPQTPDTDITAGFFIADADPASVTDPTRADTDGDGLSDGEEDANHNGAFEPELEETNPNMGDTDGDGVDDATDLCPNDPDKTEPGSQGCGVPEDIDVTPPVITVGVTPETLWPANHKLVPITVNVVVTDETDPAPTFFLLSITASEADNALGDGNTLNDIVINENDDIYLRAERSGRGVGRVYTLTYSASDISGNMALAKATVTVPHNR